MCTVVFICLCRIFLVLVYFMSETQHSIVKVKMATDRVLHIVVVFATMVLPVIQCNNGFFVIINY